jgi:glycosyltransferase involved in cell wall biosynthesis
MPQPLISVVIPVYDASRYIAEAVASALAQTHRACEIIVVNDGSHDTLELEQALAPFRNRIVYLCQENQGVSAARNAAIAIARGELLAFLDSDDVWYPQFLESQVAFLLNGNFDMVYANALLFGDRAIAGQTYMDTTPSRGQPSLLALLELRCLPIASGTLVRRMPVLDAGMFDRSLRLAEDFDLWVRLARAGARIGYQRITLLKHRLRSDSLSRSVRHPIQNDLAVFLHFRETLSLPVAESAVVDHQIRRLQGILEVERGKWCLANGRYQEARQHFRAATIEIRSAKLWAARVLLRVSPSFLQRLYARLRPHASA